MKHGSSGRPHLLALLLAACGGDAMPPAVDGAGVPDDAPDVDARTDSGIPAGTTVELTPSGEAWYDPELLQVPGESLIGWQDGAANVWVARLDLDTGLVEPGSERLLGGDSAPLIRTFNGPEFGLDASGWAAYYTQVGQDGIGQVARVRLAGNDVNLDVLTSGDEHFTAMASKDETAATTRLMMLRRPPDWGTALWMDLAPPATQHDLFPIVERPDADLRWIDGMPSLVVTNHPDLPGEISILDTTTSTLAQVSGGEGTPTSAYGWSAPEAGGALRVVAIVDSTRLVVWEEQTNGPRWSVVADLESPEAGFAYFGSPEPVVVEGHSYITFTVRDTADTIPGGSTQHVWIIGLDPDAPFALRCDDGQNGALTRVDPEAIRGRDQVFVYYYTLGMSSSRAYACATGIPTH